MTVQRFREIYQIYYPGIVYLMNVKKKEKDTRQKSENISQETWFFIELKLLQVKQMNKETNEYEIHSIIHSKRCHPMREEDTCEISQPET